MRTNLSLIFLFAAVHGNCQLTSDQTHAIDSLKLIISGTNDDNLRINALAQWDNYIYYLDPDLDFKLNKQIENICKLNLKNKTSKKVKAFYLNFYAKSLNNIGIVYANKGNYSQALKYYYQSFKIREKIKDKRNVAGTLNNIGSVYNEQGNNVKAIDYYTRSLKIREEIKDKHGIANSLGSIGIIFASQKDFKKAMYYFNRCLKITSEIGEKEGISAALNNIGNIYELNGNYVKGGSIN